MDARNLHGDTGIRTCTVKTPTRIDLAGGTLDIWPLCAILQEKFELWNTPVVTVNIAIDLFAKVTLKLEPSSHLDWTFEDLSLQKSVTGKRLTASDATDYPLHRSVTRFFSNHLLAQRQGKLTLSTSAQAPRGSGLGGSSSLVVAMLAAFSKLLGLPFSPEELCLQAKNLEAGILGSLAGDQDHFAAAKGGMQAVAHDAHGTHSVQLAGNGKDLLDHLVLAYSGQSHFSAFNNWTMLEKVLTGEAEILEKFARIAKIAAALPPILQSSNWNKLGTLMLDEWKIRRTLAEGITTPVLENLLETALSSGAVGGKVCGAGGGGVLVAVVAQPSDKKRLEEALVKQGGILLQAGYAATGICYV
jgi:D-glycero-alpha-D-manno-heptose-7-phosphate kinase